MILIRLSPITIWLRIDPWRSWTNYSPDRETGIRRRLHFTRPRLFHVRMRRIEAARDCTPGTVTTHHILSLGVLVCALSALTSTGAPGDDQPRIFAELIFPLHHQHNHA